VGRISLEEQINEVAREIGMRHTVYARRVEKGKMTQQQSDKQIQIMAAVLVSLKDYKEFLDGKA
jgi:hypothetical protein